MEEIFILRHSDAEDVDGKTVKNDFERKLTDEGIKKAKKISLFFNALNEEIDLVLSSPLIRAKETAEIFTNNITPRPKLKTVDFLSSGASCKDIVKGLLLYSSHKKVVLVGHSPDLEIFLGKLISADHINLKKTTIAKVILNNNFELSGKLEWLITPKIVKKFKLKEQATFTNN